jgi:diketogulonate reductase-like aldo/keto reductase
MFCHLLTEPAPNQERMMRDRSAEVQFDRTVLAIDPATVRQIPLGSGVMMPAAAFGTFHSDWAQDYMKDATVEAIRIGWRHLDTARAYENEAIVGESIRESIKRGYIRSAADLFITGKLWNGHMKPADIGPAVDGTLMALGVEKLDLYLNHWPWPNVHTPGCAGEHRNPDAVPYIHEQFMETWAAILKQKQAGKLIHVGTSNHTRATMGLLLRDVPDADRPVVNQMEMHPLMQQTGLRRYFELNGIVCTGYMAVGSPHRPARDTFKEHRADMEDPVILAVAEEAGITPGQVCLAWASQREHHSGGYVVMTTQPKRMVDNLLPTTKDLLNDDQMLRISGDGTPEHPGIDADNRLIWGQVFLWPEADGDWRMLWNDSQVFRTRADYDRFKASWERHHKVWEEATIH